MAKGPERSRMVVADQASKKPRLTVSCGFNAALLCARADISDGGRRSSRRQSHRRSLRQNRLPRIRPLHCNGLPGCRQRSRSRHQSVCSSPRTHWHGSDAGSDCSSGRSCRRGRGIQVDHPAGCGSSCRRRCQSIYLRRHLRRRERDRTPAQVSTRWAPAPAVAVPNSPNQDAV